MSSNINTPRKPGDTSLTAPTPQNTPMTHASISQALSRPTVAVIKEEEDEDKAEAKEIASVLQSSAARGALAEIVQKRLTGLIGQSSGYIEGLPVETKRSLAALHGVQVKWEELQKEMKQELFELEKKYHERMKPLYERRTAIVSGSSAPLLEEIEAGKKQAKEDDIADEFLPKVEDQPENAPIPDFWLNVLSNHPDAGSILSTRDTAALKYLTDVQLSYLPGGFALKAETYVEGDETGRMGYKLSFFFKPNEYFENEVLEKTYLYKDEIDWSGDFMYHRAIGTGIRWKEGKDLTKDVRMKTQRSKKTNRTRQVKKTVDVESFFNFFDPPQPPSDEAIENGEVDEYDLFVIEGALAFDFQLGDDFKDKIIPHAADWFTGKALQYEDDDGEETWDDEHSDNEKEGEGEGEDKSEE